jgi:transcriptional regulator of met regulon
VTHSYSTDFSAVALATMPKLCTSLVKKLNDLVREFGSEDFSNDGSILFCKACEKTVNHEKKYFVSQHVATSIHKRSIERKRSKSQTTIRSVYDAASSSRHSTFSSELCKAFVDAGIPLWKLENESLRSFLTKYTKQHIPSESTLRKNYVSSHYDSTMEEIKTFVQDKKIWVSIDETTDCTGRHVANVVIGTLEVGEPYRTFLLTTEELEATNSSTIAQLFTSALTLLWPEGIKYNNVLLFVTDAAPYMKKAAQGLKVMFPSMLHLT